MATVAALAGLALLVKTVIVDDDDPVDAVLDVEVVDRRIDLIEPIFTTQRSDDFELLPDGTTAGFLDIILGEDRIMRVAPGTPGEITCRALQAINRCAVFADLLGDAVVWFAILPQAPRSTVELPPIVELEGGYAHFENGWQIPYPPVIERDCGNIDIPTFRDFLRRFGPDSVSIVDLEVQQVVRVRCGEEVVAETTTPSTPVTSVGLPDESPDLPNQAPTSAP